MHQTVWGRVVIDPLAGSGIFDSRDQQDREEGKNQTGNRGQVQSHYASRVIGAPICFPAPKGRQRKDETTQDEEYEHRLSAGPK
ncbi:hypothetical protein GCM10011577_39800 [Pseudarthrobacter polychromogenes]|uniref:Uncharacterized protein n=1 Tax=Pseudarthrobacter polychromogenes TaxID=1676 RepID=A0ABQ1Y3Z9_9MICC|nr:hypothetical protein GCM10011577_39800 [Pseudarthrobacter polychromogenes]